MKNYFSLAVGISCFFATFSQGFAGTPMDEQSTCLEAAAAQFSLVEAANKASFLQALEPCESSGPSGFADRCYEIAGRRFEQASKSASLIYQADKEVCLN